MPPATPAPSKSKSSTTRFGPTPTTPSCLSSSAASSNTSRAEPKLLYPFALADSWIAVSLQLMNQSLSPFKERRFRDRSRFPAGMTSKGNDKQKANTEILTLRVRMTALEGECLVEGMVSRGGNDASWRE